VYSLSRKQVDFFILYLKRVTIVYFIFINIFAI